MVYLINKPSKVFIEYMESPYPLMEVLFENTELSDIYICLQDSQEIAPPLVMAELFLNYDFSIFKIEFPLIYIAPPFKAYPPLIIEFIIVTVV